MGRRDPLVLHPRHPAFHHHSGIQAHDARGIRAGAVRTVEQDFVPGRARPWQCGFVRHQGDGPGRHRGDRHDLLQPIYHGRCKAIRQACPTPCRWRSRHCRCLDWESLAQASRPGLFRGAPQLGAGAAIGTAGALVGGGALAGAGAAGAGRLAAGAGMGAIRAGTALTAGASTAYQMAQATSGASGAAGVWAGLSGVARAGAGAVSNAAKGAAERGRAGFSDSAQAGRDAAFRALAAPGPARPPTRTQPVAQFRAAERRIGRAGCAASSACAPMRIPPPKPSKRATGPRRGQSGPRPAGELDVQTHTATLRPDSRGDDALSESRADMG